MKKTMCGYQIRQLLRDIEDKGNLHCGQFNNIVHASHSDGSMMEFHDAFAVRLEMWTLVFTEHNGYHFFYTGTPSTKEDDRDAEVIQYYRNNLKKIPTFHSFKFKKYITNNSPLDYEYRKGLDILR